jgi:Na+/melibiose symporter-like transporter
VDGPFAMIFGLIAAVIYGGYRIDRTYHEKITDKLAERKKQSQQADNLA